MRVEAIGETGHSFSCECGGPLAIVYEEWSERLQRSVPVRMIWAYHDTDRSMLMVQSPNEWPRIDVDLLSAEQLRRIKKRPGLYALYDASGKLLYIGQTADGARVKNHLGLRTHIAHMVHHVASIRWLECWDEEWRMNIEDLAIEMYQPIFCRQSRRRPGVFIKGVLRYQRKHGH